MAGKQETAKKSRQEPSKIVTGYLILYNAAQVVGWTSLLFQIIAYYIAPSSHASLWEAVKLTVIIFQNAAVLEIVNVALGFVSSNLVITAAQVYSRVMVVGGVLLATPTAPLSVGVPLALFAWSITEIIRYSFYALNLIGQVPHFLIWCRYTFFIALYPIGITGELLCIWAAQQYVAKTGLWSYALPNALNFTFSYSYFLIISMLLYIPGGELINVAWKNREFESEKVLDTLLIHLHLVFVLVFPQLYLHMFAQRKKVLGTKVSSQTKKAK